MRVECLQISGFRCFAAEPVTVRLGEMTCLIGPNASGKTALMIALARLFGESQAERRVRTTDFHVHRSTELHDEDGRQLFVEAQVAFPERDDDSGLDAIPEFFNQMTVEAPGKPPFCRIRLEATWSNDGTADGHVEQRLWWILTSSDAPEEIESNRQPVQPAQRARIRLRYLAATRDPSTQIKSSTGSVFGQLLRSIDWDGKDEDVRQRLAELNNELAGLQGLSVVNEEAQRAWSAMYRGRVASRVMFESVESEPAALLDLLKPGFAPDDHGRSVPHTELSDGLRSLFALSLPLGLHEVESRLRADSKAAGFDDDLVETLPLLTIFAVEEPENHLSPHYLGNTVAQLKRLSALPTAQVLISSHSPSIMRRVEPDDVRYVAGGDEQPSSQIRELHLPEDEGDESYKYVREAVRGYPELYFSRLVILGEGASEEIVLRRLFEDSGAPLDREFISIVPLGGRHVHHFWRLLNALDIPYLTLLDLDLGKKGGGWGRLQYVRDELVELHRETPSKLTFNTQGKEHNLADTSCDTLAKETSSPVPAVTTFRDDFDVFFCCPLDLDLLMLEAFENVYVSQAPSNGGPRLPKDEKKRELSQQKRMRVVLTNAEDEEVEHEDEYHGRERLFPWYAYLFLHGSKPVAHMRALAELETEWADKAPETLRLLVERAKKLLASDEE